MGLYFSGKYLIDSLIAVSQSLVATVKKETDLAVGNILGSNIFNIGFILATSSIINPIKVFSESIVLHIILILIATAILFIGNFTLKKRTIDREEGLLLLLIYGIFLMSLFHS